MLQPYTCVCCTLSAQGSHETVIEQINKTYEWSMARMSASTYSVYVWLHRQWFINFGGERGTIPPISKISSSPSSTPTLPEEKYCMIGHALIFDRCFNTLEIHTRHFPLLFSDMARNILISSLDHLRVLLKESSIAQKIQTRSANNSLRFTFTSWSKEIVVQEREKRREIGKRGCESREGEGEGERERERERDGCMTNIRHDHARLYSYRNFPNGNSKKREVL